MICKEVPSCADGPAAVVRFLAALTAVVVLALSCTDVRAAESARLTGFVDASMLARADAAIARGDRVVEIASNGGLMAEGWQIAAQFKVAGISVRCVGVCASAAAQILIGSGHCIVSRQGRVVLHRPHVVLANLDAASFAVLDGAVMKIWRQKMAEVGVPSDIVFRTEQAYRGELELNEYGMKRVGCSME